MTNVKRPAAQHTIAGRALRPESLVMSYGYDPHEWGGSIRPVICQTSTFAFRSCEQGAAHFRLLREGDISPDTEFANSAYTRLGNPSFDVVEARLTLFDGAEAALCFASGMSAITTTLLTFVKSGSVVLHAGALYGASEVFIRQTLPQLGVQAFSLGAALDESEIRRAVEIAQPHGPIDVIYTETPSNPTNELVDLELCVRIADEIGVHQAGRRPVVMTDNTFLGPIGQSPLDHGVDVVLYSLTKYIGGHSDLIAGAALGAKALMARIRAMRELLGGVPDPHTCALLTRSLDTVKLRMERAFDTARQCAEFLRGHPKVERVQYLGFDTGDPLRHSVIVKQCKGSGSTFSFDIQGGQAAAFRVLDALQLIKLAVSLGGAESLICHPGTTTHSSLSPERQVELGFTPGMARLSVGLEDPDDLIADLDQALAHA